MNFNVIKSLNTKSPTEEKYKVIQELSSLLYEISTFMDTYNLSYILVSCFTNNQLIAQCITKELTSITSMHGLGIFDIQIIEAFVAGMDISIEYNSIIYLKGYIGINTLINIKKYIGGEVLDFLNSLGPDFSLKQIGDFVDNLMDEIETKNLDEAEAKILVNDSVKNQLQKIEQLQQGPQTTQPLDPMGLSRITREPTAVPVGEGGKNNHISNPKHNTKYHKKYKKFVSKYIIKKKKNNKNNKKNKNNKNKTRKNKRLTKSTPNSKRNNKTLKNKKSKSKLKSKSSKHKSKQNNKKAKTNYYNLYKHNKTLKH
jgi:hypothetical protein